MPTIALARRFALTATLLLPLMLAACAVEEERGPLEQAGEQADETIEETGEALEEESEEIEE
jgi:hypothetical protein